MTPTLEKNELTLDIGQSNGHLAGIVNEMSEQIQNILEFILRMVRVLIGSAAFLSMSQSEGLNQPNYRKFYAFRLRQ
jgi:hypothetical protein